MKIEEQMAVEYALKKGNRLIVEKKYSSNVAEVSYTDKALLITFRNNKEAYTYPDTKRVVTALFNKFVDRYMKIKSDTKNREKYSLGQLANDLNKIYPKVKK